MSKNKKSFKTELKKDWRTLKQNVQSLDQRIVDDFQKDIKEAKSNIQLLDRQLEELHPSWCEYWRLKRRKDREERRLKRFSHY